MSRGGRGGRLRAVGEEARCGVVRKVVGHRIECYGSGS